MTSAARIASLPDLPTAVESGLPAPQVSVWHGLYAPKGTPKTAVEKLTAALQAAAKEADFAKRMSELGASICATDRMTPAAHAAHLKAEIDKWGPIIRKAGAYAD